MIDSGHRSFPFSACFFKGNLGKHGANQSGRCFAKITSERLHVTGVVLEVKIRISISHQIRPRKKKKKKTCDKKDGRLSWRLFLFDGFWNGSWQQKWPLYTWSPNDLYFWRSNPSKTRFQLKLSGHVRLFWWSGIFRVYPVQQQIPFPSLGCDDSPVELFFCSWLNLQKASSIYPGSRCHNLQKWWFLLDDGLI